MSSKPHFIVNLPATLLEWCKVAGAVGVLVTPIVGSVWLAWKDLKAGQADTESRLFSMERSVMQVQSEVTQIRGILMSGGRVANSTTANVHWQADTWTNWGKQP